MPRDKRHFVPDELFDVAQAFWDALGDRKTDPEVFERLEAVAALAGYALVDPERPHADLFLRFVKLPDEPA